MGQSLANLKSAVLQPEIIVIKNCGNKRRSGNKSAQRQRRNAKHAPSDEERMVSATLPTSMLGLMLC